MNPAFLPLIASLIGQQEIAPQEAPAVPAEPPQPDIEVSSRPASKYKDGLIGGPFRAGRLGGNILGAIGDALLVQSGNKPVYTPRLQRAREAEALRGFSADPLRSIQDFAQVNPEGSRDWYNDFSDNQRADSANAARIGALGDAKSARINDIGRRLLTTATANTYPAIKARLESYYTKNGVTPEFDLPAEYDADAIRSITNASVPVDKQMTRDDLDAYRAQRLALSRESLGIRRQQVGNSYSLGRARVGIAGRNANTAAGGLTEREKHDRAMEARPTKGGTGGKRALSRVLQPDGTYKYTVQ